DRWHVTLTGPSVLAPVPMFALSSSLSLSLSSFSLSTSSPPLFLSLSSSHIPLSALGDGRYQLQFTVFEPGNYTLRARLHQTRVNISDQAMWGWRDIQCAGESDTSALL